MYFFFFQRNLLLLDKYPGEYEFAVKISPNSKRFPTFSEKLNTLFIHSQTTFAVEFDVCPESLPPNLCIVAMVCYSDATQLAEHGPILPCSCNAHMSNRSECGCVCVCVRVHVYVYACPVFSHENFIELCIQV